MKLSNIFKTGLTSLTPKLTISEPSVGIAPLKILFSKRPCSNDFKDFVTSQTMSICAYLMKEEMQKWLGSLNQYWNRYEDKVKIEALNNIAQIIQRMSYISAESTEESNTSLVKNIPNISKPLVSYYTETKYLGVNSKHEGYKVMHVAVADICAYSVFKTLHDSAGKSKFEQLKSSALLTKKTKDALTKQQNAGYKESAEELELFGYIIETVRFTVFQIIVGICPTDMQDLKTLSYDKGIMSAHKALISELKGNSNKHDAI